MDCDKDTGRPELLADIKKIVPDFTNVQLGNLLRTHRSVFRPERTKRGVTRREEGAVEGACSTVWEAETVHAVQ